jgi:isopropylmalate/homocitrate/citramalate synthase
MPNDNLIIFDTTMRDGEQSFRLHATRDEKLRTRAPEREWT